VLPHRHSLRFLFLQRFLVCLLPHWHLRRKLLLHRLLELLLPHLHCLDVLKSVEDWESDSVSVSVEESTSELFSVEIRDKVFFISVAAGELSKFDSIISSFIDKVDIRCAEVKRTNMNV